LCLPTFLFKGETELVKRIFISAAVIAFIGLSAYCSKDNPSESKDNNPDSTAIEGWELVWNDEFNGSSINLDKWEYEVNGSGGGNNELQYYTDRAVNSFIENGKLVIKALQEVYTGGDNQTRYYTSARLRTLNKGDWLYGRFDVKAKLPYGQGLWPAIWMLPTDWEYGGWAASGEIDIVEMLGQETRKIYGTIHYGGSYPANTHKGGSYTLKEGTFAGDFHVFTLEWEEKEMRWYVDGKLYYTQNDWYTTNGNYPAPFDKRFHLLLNVAVGGNWPGNPVESTTWPQQMDVEYVRVYKKK